MTTQLFFFFVKFKNNYLQTQNNFLFEKECPYQGEYSSKICVSACINAGLVASPCNCTVGQFGLGYMEEQYPDAPVCSKQHHMTPDLKYPRDFPLARPAGACPIHRFMQNITEKFMGVCKPDCDKIKYKVSCFNTLHLISIIRLWVQWLNW